MNWRYLRRHLMQSAIVLCLRGYKIKKNEMWELVCSQLDRVSERELEVPFWERVMLTAGDDAKGKRGDVSVVPTGHPLACQDSALKGRANFIASLRASGGAYASGLCARDPSTRWRERESSG